MKKIILIIYLLSLHTYAGLNSAFVGTVEGLDTPNSHYVGDSSIIRGQAPRSLKEFEQLKEIGIENVIIFKNQTKNEVDQEIAILKKLKIPYTHIDFPWKDISSFQPVCEKALKALKILKDNNDQGKLSYFHCTVGEDRTGVLSGLLLQVFGIETDIGTIYQEEMCAKGFSDGNQEKIFSVANLVRINLNPVFLKMSYLLKKVNYQLEKVNCAENLEQDLKYLKSHFSKPLNFKCQ